MIVSYICGGLGNQLFQYAMAYSVAKKLNKELYLDISSYKRDKKRKFCLNNFNISTDRISSNGFGFGTRFSKRFFSYALYKLGFFPRWQWIKEQKNKILNLDFLKIDKKIYLQGYWQNTIYFDEFSEKIRNQFCVLDLDFDLVRNYITILNKPNSVCIHIRRGDYISNQRLEKKYGICSMDYYNNSISRLSTIIQSPNFFVFSDDPEWVKHSFKIQNHDFNIVSTKQLEKSDLYEFYLMTLCNHFIIPNSTFSWWAAWLSNNNKNKVVLFPGFVKSFFNFTPDNWYEIKS